MKDATIKHLIELEELEQSKDKKAKLNERLKQVKDLGIMGNLSKYAKHRKNSSISSTPRGKVKELFHQGSVNHIFSVFKKPDDMKSSTFKSTAILPPISIRKVLPFSKEEEIDEKKPNAKLDEDEED